MRLLVLTTYYPPEACAACVRIGHVIQRIAHSFSDEVRVAVFNPLYKTMAGVEQEPDPPYVMRYHGFGIPAPFFLPQSLNPLIFLYWSYITLKEIHRFRPDVVFSSAPPFGPVLPAGVIAAAFKTGFILDYRDDLTAIIDHVAKKKHCFSGLLLRVLNRIVSVVFRRLVRRAALVSVANDTLKDTIGILNPEIVIMPNGIDADEFEEVHRTFNRSLVLERWGHGQTDCAILIHVSDLNVPYYQPEIFLDAIRSLVKEGERILFFIVGDGARREMIKARVRETGLSENVVMTGRLPHKEVISLLFAADAAVYALSPEDPQSRHAIGAKIYEYLGCGLPVLAVGDKGSATGRFIAGRGAGLHVPWEEIGALPSALREILENASYRNNVENTRSRFLESYDRKRGEDGLIDRMRAHKGN